ncbi:MAG: histidine kinase [Dysgonamonadaceae bacterium]|jgi:sensor histidine kinase YesM|nr:histidine kinase [Dysgonamonadaceae bacterium]
MGKVTAKKSHLNWRTAFGLALFISLLMNMIFLIMFFYGHDPNLERGPMRHEFRLDFTVIRILANFSIAFLLYLVNFYFLKRQGLSSKRKIEYIILSVLLSTFVLSYLWSAVHFHFDENMFHPKAIVFGGLFRDYFIAVVVVLTSQLIYISNKQQNMALENEMLQAEYMKSRFMSLKSQIDPHFLFNSLNTLSSLITTDSEKAVEYVQQLSFVFRYTLQNKEIITLEDELNFTLAYCHLMQIRYGSNLQIIRKIDAKYHTYSVVPLSLQTLVENAIKHNVVSNKQPLPIVLSTTERATVIVSNPIQLKKDSEHGERIGLSNLAELYRLLWNKEIEVRSADGVFEVEIPLIA